MTLAEYVKELEQECEKYRRAALSYGVDADGMLMLAKSQIRTAANNIHLMDELEFYYDLADDHIPRGLQAKDVIATMVYIDSLLDRECNIPARESVMQIVHAALEIMNALLSRSAEKEE